jgi:predicted metal-dependent hydrolase
LPSVELGDTTISYRVVGAPGRRYTYFRFAPDLTLEVLVPSRGRTDVEGQIRAKEDWILKERVRISKSKAVLTDRSLLFGGKMLRLDYRESPADALVPDFDAGVVAVTSSERRGVKELVRRWFLKETSAHVVKRVRELTPLVGRRPTRVDVREMGKWGYCTREGRLSFSWQLAALSDELKDYVILHELTHLVVFDHSTEFRRRLGSVCPQRKRLERELDLVLPYHP